jgi:glycerophosphoryl diester phosphodiesterase
VGGQPDDILVPAMPALRRIGHKGADLIVPGNTTASFDAALAAGVDMIEFDVLPEVRDDPGSRLVLAHDYDHAAGAPALTDGLAHLASSPFADVELDVDLKLPGYEARVVDALRAHGLVERALVSSNWMRSLVALRELEPALRLGWSVPRVRRDRLASPLTKVPAYVGLGVLRARLPGVYARHHAAGRCDALMAHWALVTPRLVRAVRGAGGELYAWTVDQPARIGRLERLGVTGVITNDPRLFGQRPSVQVAAE